ncbi:MAG: DUF2007 domain-containing protein [Candidatus Promineifilaceae bacterium]|nr:DUF2007 domain-containing protein [Candidatus Promineifilaceae bacterium]
MGTDISGALPINDADGHDETEDSSAAEQAAEARGGRREVQWQVATKTGGLAPAEMIAQYLRNEGIPARAWQEGAGRALGLTVGLLGTGYVMVPESQLERAKTLLDELEEADDWPLEEDE